METRKRISGARRIIGDVLLALAVFLTADVVIVMTGRINAVVQKSEYREVFLYQLILCAVLLLLALDVRFNLFTRWKSVFLRGVGWFLRAVVVLLSAVTLFFCGKVIAGGLIREEGPADHAIVLGLALENGEPTPNLKSRLDTAREFLDKNPGAQLILTGGNADASVRSEADVMRDLTPHQVRYSMGVDEVEGNPAVVQAAQACAAGNWEMGRSLAQAALQQNPNEAEACYVLGIIERNARNYTASDSWFSKAYSLKPESKYMSALRGNAQLQNDEQRAHAQLNSNAW